ncbi:MAG: tetratricopeptide repeat protein, partial [Anaerolineae bacterium]
RLSLWGSYERLQGTYTTLSYMVVFFLTLSTLRTREQLDRLITTMILVSLPIALYGVVQHYGLDPLPWLGDVTTRVASSMGNSIFVAAYLIMVVPLTLARLVDSLSAILADREDVVSHFVLAACYIFVLIAQLACIFFSQSRGPWLGLMGGVFFFTLFLALARRARGLTLGIIGVAVVLALFLVVLNLPHTPLAPIKDMPYIGRLGKIFETEAGTGKVRVLIWEGTVRLVTADPLRTLIGYGPETMHVAYNPYYPPDLAHYERRRASPDRAHNETFDALVITGLVGFVAYLLLFSSLFYYGLKWLGLIRTSRQRNGFFALWIIFGLLAVLGFRLADGTWRFFGVALPAGMMVGLFVYLAISALLARDQESRGHPHQLLLVALFAAIVAHFIEIHFGIAIAATRTYFWVYAALLVIAGFLYQERPALVATPGKVSPPRAPNRRRRRRRAGRRAPRPARDTRGLGGLWQGPLFPYSLLAGLILMTMAFDFFGVGVSFSPSMLWLFALTWLFAGAISMAETGRNTGLTGTQWLGATLIYALVSGGWFFLFRMAQVVVMAPGNDIANAPVLYYLFLFAATFILALILLRREPLPLAFWRGLSGWLYPLLAAGTVVLIFMTNVNVVKADIYYKQASVGFQKRGEYDAAIEYYTRALKLAPDQDRYYLFLGGALLEKAKRTTDAAQQRALLEQDREILEKAQELNPLNPDHTANLARLYQAWGQLTTDPQERVQRLNKSLNYYRQATQLSPNTAHLYNEWGWTYYIMGDYDKALEKYQYSLGLDQQFDQTYVRLGELYRTQKKWDQAEEAYQKALELNPRSVEAHSALAFVYAQQGELEKAVEENLKVIELSPNDLASHRNLAILYQQLGRLDQALAEARRALELAPGDQVLEAFVENLERRKQ